MKWAPAKVIWSAAREVVLAAVASIRTAVRVPHRGTEGAPGGSLVTTMLGPEFIRRRRWGAVIRWSEAGQALLFFKEGTSRQAARDFETLPVQATLEEAIRADGQRWFEEREARYGRAA